MLRISRQILQIQNASKTCVRTMAKKREYTKKTTRKMREEGWVFDDKGQPKKRLPDIKIPSRLNVILLDEHEKLGNAGQMISVKAGYARNVLVPEGIAIYSTEENKKRFLSFDAVDDSPETPVCPRFLKFLQSTQLKIQRKEGSEFFEVNEHHIALEYESQFELFVPVHCVKLEEPITTFGDFEVNIAVRDNVLVPMKITVEQWSPDLPDWVEAALKTESDEEEKVQAKGD